MVHPVEQYQRRLAKRLRCCAETKETLLAPFRQSLDAYLETTPGPSFEQLCAAFGTPEDMAIQMMECVSEEDAKKYRKQQRVKRIIAALAVLVLLLVSVYVFFEKEFSNISVIHENSKITSYSAIEGE